MRVSPITAVEHHNGRNVNLNRKNLNAPVSMPQYNSLSNVYYMPLSPSFNGLRFETNVVQKVLGKQYQGAGMYSKNKDFIDFAKIGYEKLIKEPLNIVKATKNEIAAHRFALALAETYAIGSTFGTQWVKRYNPENRNSPLAVSHTLNDEKLKEELFAPNLELLYDKRFGKSLDVPITDKDGNLCLDAVVFDTETTGANPAVDRIVQIATMQIKNGQLVPEKSVDQLINPEIPMPAGAQAVHGISDEMVKDAPKIDEYLGTFLNDTLNKQNGVIVAYNGKFDVPLLNRMIREHNINSEDHYKEKSMAKVLDPFILIQRIHPFLGAKKKLGFQYHWLFCKPMENAHDALADVRGTVDVLKYCLYYLSEHRKDKSVPLTLREVLIFQNGGQGVENIDIPMHPTKNYNSSFKFDESYRSEPLDIDNYFQGYKLTKKDIQRLAPEIGKENANRLLQDDIEGTNVSESKTQKEQNASSFKPLSYIAEKNFRKVLNFANLEAYNGKSKEEIMDLIVDNSKKYLKEKTKEIWLKNVDPDDISKGNDLPDDNITRRVMRESQAV